MDGRIVHKNRIGNNMGRRQFEDERIILKRIEDLSWIKLEDDAVRSLAFWIKVTGFHV
jgi:hypothetical protein